MNSLTDYIAELYQVGQLSQYSRDKLLGMLLVREQLIKEVHQIIMHSQTVYVGTGDYYRDSTRWLDKSGYGKL